MKYEMTISVIWAWLVPQWYMEFAEYRSALQQSHLWGGRGDSSDATDDTVDNIDVDVDVDVDDDDDDDDDDDVRKHENSSSNSNSKTTQGQALEAARTRQAHQKAKTALYSGAGLAIWTMLVLYTITAVFVALPTRNLDRRANHIVTGFGRIVSSLLLAIFSVTIPRWMGVSYSSRKQQRKSPFYYQRQVECSLIELRFRVCWSFLGYFFLVYPIMIPYLGNIDPMTVPVCTIVGIVFGFGVLWSVWLARTIYASKKKLIASIVSVVLAALSAGAFEYGCYYIKYVWYPDGDLNFEDSSVLVTSFVCFGLILIVNYCIVMYTKWKISQALREGRSAMELQQRYTSEQFKPPKSIAASTKKLGMATAHAAVSSIMLPATTTTNKCKQYNNNNNNSNNNNTKNDTCDENGDTISAAATAAAAAKNDAQVGNSKTDVVVTAAPSSKIQELEQPLPEMNESDSGNDHDQDQDHDESTEMAAEEDELLASPASRSSLAHNNVDDSPWPLSKSAPPSITKLPSLHTQSTTTASTSRDIQNDDYALISLKDKENQRQEEQQQQPINSPPQEWCQQEDMYIEMALPVVVDPCIESGREEHDNDIISPRPPPLPLEFEENPSCWYMMRNNFCWGTCNHHEHRNYNYDDENPRSTCENVIFFAGWIFYGIVCSSHIYLAIINIGASLEQNSVRDALPGTFELLYPSNYTTGAMCAWNESSTPNGDIRTFDTLDEVYASNYSVIHCGSCANCSNWNDLSLQWTTKTYLAEVAQKW